MDDDKDMPDVTSAPPDFEKSSNTLGNTVKNQATAMDAKTQDSDKSPAQHFTADDDQHLKPVNPPRETESFTSNNAPKEQVSQQETSGLLLGAAESSFKAAMLQKKDEHAKKIRQTSAEKERQLARDLLIRSNVPEALNRIAQKQQYEIKEEESDPPQPDAFQRSSSSPDSPVLGASSNTQGSATQGNMEYEIHRQKYEAKQKDGTATLIDAINFKKVEEAERKRQNELAAERQQELD